MSEIEKPRVTEIQVRLDCNGCVQKIKKALHGIKGIVDIYIDIPQQKLTVIGWVDPEKIVKAIKKTRKAATICYDTEPTTEPPEPPKEPENPPPEGIIQEPTQSPPSPPPQEPPSTDSTPREAEEVHVVYHYPPDHYYRYSHDPIYNASMEHYSSSRTHYKYIRPPLQYTHYSRPEPPQPSSHYSKPEPPPEPTHYRSEPPPLRYTHYNRSEPPPQHTQYTRPEPPQQYTHYNRPEPPPEYTHYYSRPEPPVQYTQYNRAEPQPFANYRQPDQPPPRYTHYNEEYHSSSNGNGNITSIFSDENPNACTIV